MSIRRALVKYVADTAGSSFLTKVGEAIGNVIARRIDPKWDPPPDKDDDSKSEEK